MKKVIESGFEIKEENGHITISGPDIGDYYLERELITVPTETFISLIEKFFGIKIEKKED